MSVQGLLALFLLLYLVECLAWVPKGRFLLQRGAWGPWRLKAPGLRLKSPLPAGLALPVQPEPGWELLPPRSGAVELAAERLAGVQREARPLHWCGRALLLAMAGLLWLWALPPGPGRAEAFLACLGLALALHLACLWLLRRAWGRLDPSVHGRGEALAIAALSPWASARCADLLCRAAFREAHPAALAAAALPLEGLRELSGAWLRRAAWPDAGVAATDQAWAAWLRAHEVDPLALLQEPWPDSLGAAAWCPRCLAQYSSPRARCGDCGTALKPFSGMKKPPFGL